MSEEHMAERDFENMVDCAKSIRDAKGCGVLWAARRIAELELELKATDLELGAAKRLITELRERTEELEDALDITYDWLTSDTIFMDFRQIDFHRAVLRKVLLPTPTEPHNES